MANRLNQLLKQWRDSKDSQKWVLATIIETDGSSYRKAGAMMMINDLGQYFGLLSGGCLESDIMLQARRCWDSGHNRIVEYDMREEEDLAWKLGIGCGGMVRILLQPVDGENDYLQLDNLYALLEANEAAEYCQVIDQKSPKNTLSTAAPSDRPVAELGVFKQVLKPAPHLAVFGGGVDARPVVAIAMQLGWQITLVDPRTSYARDGHFDASVNLVRQPINSLGQSVWLQQIDMALIMTHNIKLDAQSLALVQSSAAKYVGMLGPIHRTDRVLDLLPINRDQLTKPLANPVGLRLGGELPESIALSMLSEAHAFIEQQDGLSISGILS
ncbi:XdhC/CoxI family protein [Paraglaciecola sp. 20A4]|uniref:XdhC family protein n=1 Tax=Paraglaciecola sp. 20A4 TaxID=2687288 RepID=UPI00140DFE3B